MDEFDEWYKAYPRKRDPIAARKAYDKARANGATSEDLKLGAIRYAQERAGEDPQFTKHPATWLNRGSWMNEPEVKHAKTELQSAVEQLRDSISRDMADGGQDSGGPVVRLVSSRKTA